MFKGSMILFFFQTHMFVEMLIPSVQLVITGPLLHFVGRIPLESRQGCRMLKMQQDWRRQTLKPSAQMQPPAEPR